MKKIIYISLLIISPLIIRGQEKVYSLEEKENKISLHTENTKEKSTALKDSSGKQVSVSDSSNSNKGKDRENLRRKRKRMMDSFMDKDGDGINDSRTKGMGLSGKGKHKGFGRHGK